MTTNAIAYIRHHVLRCTQAELADIVGVTQGAISDWERGRSQPRLEDLHSLRHEIVRRKLPWNDAWLFDPPKTEANDA